MSNEQAFEAFMGNGVRSVERGTTHWHRQREAFDAGRASRDAEVAELRAQRDEFKRREIDALRRTWRAFGCELSPDDFRADVRDAIWGQIEKFARDAESDDRALVRRADAAEAEMHARELHHFESEERLEAAEAVIAAALAVPDLLGSAHQMRAILTAVPQTVLAERDRKNRFEAWWEGAEDERLNGSPVNPYTEKEQSK